MRSRKKLVTILFSLVSLLLINISAAQSSSLARPTARARAADEAVTLGTAKEPTALDCSHFVNFLLGQVGLDYEYQPSRALYRGTSAFKRVYRPIAGDLIVWPGHVGIVVDPDDKTFVSALRRGIRVASYTSRYWLRKGRPRFLRYSLQQRSPAFEARDLGVGQTFSAEGQE